MASPSLQAHFPADDWPCLVDEFEREYMQNLCHFLGTEAASPWHPQPNDVFAAFHLTSLDEVRVVIVGQDPYPEPWRATGLAFSVPSDLRPHPLSLRNIFHELQTDLDHAGRHAPPMSGDLTRWARQGVLLLNRALTVRKGKPGSHRKNGWWARFTLATMKAVDAHRRPVVFLLWGKDAQSVADYVHVRHCVIRGAHPAYRGGQAPDPGEEFDSERHFFGGRYFSRANAFLRKHGRDAVDW